MKYLVVSHQKYVSDIGLFWFHTNGRVFNKELYTYKIQEFIFLHLYPELF